MVTKTLPNYRKTLDKCFRGGKKGRYYVENSYKPPSNSGKINIQVFPATITFLFVFNICKAIGNTEKAFSRFGRNLIKKSTSDLNQV